VTDFDQSTDSWSLFGQADFDLTERLTLSAGLRYTDEEKDVDMARTILRPGIFSLFVFPPYAPFSDSRSESVTDGLVNVSFKAQENLMFYVSWAHGTKSGGFAHSATLLDQAEYEAEEAQTAELGVRYESGDGQLTANATLYSTDVTDYQLVTFTGTQFRVDNTDLEALGIETEIFWRPLFAPGLDITWRNTYNDAEDANTGAEIPRAPRWSGGVVFAYTQHLAQGWRWTLDASVDYESGQTHQQNPDAVPRADSITMYGAGIGVESDNGLSLRLVGRNLTDENRYTFVFPTPFLPSGNAMAQSERPRTVALQVSYRY
jgi:iron complex outermembrane receptor protein